jgi:ABC-type sulfate transport system permease subunit
MMAFLGSFFSFSVSVVFPELCYLVLYGSTLTLRDFVVEFAIALMGVVFAVSGTLWAILENS